MSNVLSGVLLGFFMGMLSFSSKANEPPVLVYGYPDVSVWTTERDVDKQLKNPLLKLASLLFEEAGVEWQGRTLPAKRLFKYLQEGIVPFSMLVRAPSLESCCLFSDRPIASTELRVYRRQGTQSVNIMHDLIGRRVILIKGYSYAGLGKYLRDPSHQVEFQEASSHKEASNFLSEGVVTI